VATLLIDDRVDRDRRLPGAAVADDQLTLPPADRDHRVDRLDPRLERLLDRLPQHDPGGDDVDETTPLDRLDRALPVLRLAERVDDAPEVSGADRDVQDPPGPPDRVALVERGPVTHDDRADIVLFEVQRERRDRLSGLGGGDLQHLARHGPGEPVDAGDPVLDLEDLTDLLDLERLLVPLDLPEEDVLDLTRAQMRFRARHGNVPVRAPLSPARRHLRLEQVPPERYETPPQRTVQDAVLVADDDPAQNLRIDLYVRDDSPTQTPGQFLGDIPLQALVRLPRKRDLHVEPAQALIQ